MSIPTSPHLDIRGLSHSYGPRLALQNVSIALGKSEILALVGPSGSGKSTLIAAIAGIVKPHAGAIYLAGRNLLDLPPEARELGMVFQDYALWPHMSVAQNVAFPLRARKTFSVKEINARVGDALSRVGLAGFEERRCHEISGGQQQRVALARAVVAETQLLLLDEPLSALDPATRASVRGELADILRQLNLATIIVTHDREEAFELADRIALLVDGQIQQLGPPQEIYERPANLSVARFMGVNILPARLIGGHQAQLADLATCFELPDSYRAGAAHLTIPPERTRLVAGAEGTTNILEGALVKTQYRGGEYRIHLRVGQGDQRFSLEARAHSAPEGKALQVHLPPEHLFVIGAPAQPAPQPASITISK